MLAPDGMASDEGDALLRNILEEPKSLDLRLIYADWLEDEAMMPEQAEIIRTQIELFRRKKTNKRSSFADESDAQLGKRMAALFQKHRGSGIPHQHVFGNPSLREIFYERNEGDGSAIADESDWKLRSKHKARYRCGMVFGVSMPLVAFMVHARTLFSALPIEAVELCDRGRGIHVEHVYPHDFLGAWIKQSPENWSQLDNPWKLPACLYDRLPEELVRADFGTPQPVRRNGKMLHPRLVREWDVLNHALSWACVCYGRELAGLPVLTSKPWLEEE